MALDKAIEHGKEKRVQYGTKGQPYCKAVDSTCRNHGSCIWCYHNRTHSFMAKKYFADLELKKFKRGDDDNGDV